MKNPGVYRLGRCGIIYTIDEGEHHISISTANALPSYKEMKHIRYLFCPDDIYMAEIFPPSDEFVNAHPFTRHLWQININKSNYERD